MSYQTENIREVNVHLPLVVGIMSISSETGNLTGFEKKVMKDDFVTIRTLFGI